MTILNTVDFETGDFTQGLSTSGAGVTVQTSVVKNGTYAMQAAASTADFFRIQRTNDAILDGTNLYVGFWFRKTNTTSDRMVMRGFENSVGDTVFRLWAGTANNRFDLTASGGGSLITSANNVLVPDTWQYIEIYCQMISGAGNSLVSLWVDGVNIGQNVAIPTLNYGGLVWRQVIVSGTSATGLMYFDDIVLSDTNLYTSPSSDNNTDRRRSCSGFFFADLGRGHKLLLPLRNGRL